MLPQQISEALETGCFSLRREMNVHELEQLTQQ
jgi:hypothetical protein